MIDISTVQAFQGEKEIREMVDLTKEYGFGSVHVLPAWVPFAKELLKGVDNVLLGAPVGFPSGGANSSIKAAEARKLFEEGVDELDMMMNVGKLRSSDYDFVLRDIRDVLEVVDVPVKVIIETHYLSADEIRKACDLCIEAPAAFIKTSTGWANTGATIENVTLITSHVGDRIRVKAAGGIRNLDTLITMYKLGVRRFGVNHKAAVDIINECKQLPQQVVQLEE